MNKLRCLDFTGPDGTRYEAVPSPINPCSACAMHERVGHCGGRNRQFYMFPGQSNCTENQTGERIIWQIGAPAPEPAPNPL